MASGEGVIGHIKGFLELVKNNYGYFSTVGTKDGVHYKGDLNGEKAIAKLDYNVLLYGLSIEKVDRLASEILNKSGEQRALAKLEVLPLNKNKKE